MAATKRNKFPLHKRLLSYFYEIELERTESIYDYDLSICLSDGKVQLSANNSIYSWEDKYDNFLHVFKQIDFSNKDWDSVLVLGFGLGSIPQMLEQKFKQEYNYVGVEIDPNVIYLAQKYTLHNLKSPVQIIETDAKHYMAMCASKFDVICIDIFKEAKVPPYFNSKEFLALVKAALKNNGVIIFNHLTRDVEETKKSNEYFVSIFNKMFPEATRYEKEGNTMLTNISLD